jgi:hypothetical protein
VPDLKILTKHFTGGAMGARILSQSSKKRREMLLGFHAGGMSEMSESDSRRIGPSDSFYWPSILPDQRNPSLLDVPLTALVSLAGKYNANATHVQFACDLMLFRVIGMAQDSRDKTVQLARDTSFL